MPNSTPQTATVITTLPYVISQAANRPADAGLYVPSCGSPGPQNDPAWWVYTPRINETVIGITVNSTPSAYSPDLSVWQGTLPSLTQIAEACVGAGNNIAGTFSLNVTPGVPIYLFVSTFSGAAPVGSTLTLSVQASPNQNANAGSILVLNDTTGYPATMLSPTGQILRSFALPASEEGDTIPSGVFCILEESADQSIAVAVNLYDQNLVLQQRLTSLVVANQSPTCPIRSDRNQTFYVSQRANTSTAPATILTLSAAGVVGGTTWVLPSNSKNLAGMAPNRAGTILYYYSAQAFPPPIHAYDLVHSTPLSDLYTVPSGYVAGRDLFVTAAGDILGVFENDNISPSTWYVLRISAAGSLLNTYDISPSTASAPRIALGLDDPSSFWAMTFPNESAPAPVSRFTNIRISDGTVLSTFDVPQGPVSNLGGVQFGPSQSCPLLLLPQFSTAPTIGPAPPPPPPPPGPGVIGNMRTLLLDMKAKRWFSDCYPSRVTDRVWEPGAGVHDQILCHADGTVDVFGGTTDQGQDIPYVFQPPAIDAGDPRMDKLFGDLFVESDPKGGPGCTVTPNYNDFQNPLPASTGVGASLSGRQPFIVDIQSGLGLLARNLGIVVQGTDSVGPVFFLWEPAFVPKAEVTDLRATDFENCGYDGAKFVQGILISFQSGGINKPLQVEFDNGSFSETFVVNDTQESQVAYSFQSPFVAHLVRVVPQDLTPWHLYAVTWRFQPFPELVSVYQTPPTTKDFPGFSQDERILVAHISTQDFNLIVQADTTTITIPVPNSGGLYKKTEILLPANKGLAWQYAIRTISGQPGVRLFLQDMEVRSRAWGSSESYQPLRIFGEQSRESSAARV